MRVNGTQITEATILATRQHFADINSRCIAGALDGSLYVNDLNGYVAHQRLDLAIAQGRGGMWR